MRTAHDLYIRSKPMTSLNRSSRYLRMPSYDATDCDPPAPVAQVTLRNVHSGETVADVPLLLDTGADVTLLPRNTVEQLGVQLVAGQRYELMGFNGSTSSAPVVMLDLLFLKRAFRGRCLVIEEGRGIMGCWMVRNNSGRNIHAVDPQRRDRHQGERLLRGSHRTRERRFNTQPTQPSVSHSPRRCTGHTPIRLPRHAAGDRAYARMPRTSLPGSAPVGWPSR